MLTGAEQLVLDLLIAAAREGRRCPTSGEIYDAMLEAGAPGGGWKAIVPDLARRGLIVVEVYGRNYRVVEIRQAGPYYGKRTAPAPQHYGAPYAVIGAP